MIFCTRNWVIKTLLSISLLCFILPSYATDYYVNASATGTGSGADWANAYTTLQAALSVANSGDNIFVAAGTYTSTQQYDFSNGSTTTGDTRAVSFRIPSGVRVFGGFNATTAGIINVDANGFVTNTRDLVANETILSGELGVAGNADNAYHVVFMYGVSANTVLDGFTVRDGNANGSTADNTRGGGLYNHANTADSDPTIRSSIFINNEATFGGAILNQVSNSGRTASPLIESCSFVNNTATRRAGAIYNNAVTGTSSPRIINCSFSLNIAQSNPGGATEGGGALFNASAPGGTCQPFIRNSIFWNNRVTGGGSGISWKNSSATPNVSHTLVQEGNASGLFTNTAAINPTMLFATDPLFVDAINGNLNILSCSPAVDKGINVATSSPTDVAGNQRVQFGTVDMGAYEATNNTAVTALFVETTGNDNNTGLDFNNAFATIEKALSVACDGTSIYVAAGTYLPTKEFDFDASGGTDVREVTLQIKNGVKLYGGFIGNETSFTQADLDARDLETNETILSGDIGTPNDITDNAHHILYFKSVDNTTVIDGFTVTKGNADIATIGNPNGWGGAILNDGSGSGVSSLPTIINTRFEENRALFGGAVFNQGTDNGNASPTFINTIFWKNTASRRGGAMYNNSGNGTTNPVITNCTFVSNLALGTTNDGGGALFNASSGGTCEPFVRNSIFWENYSADKGNTWFNSSITSTPNIAYSLVEDGDESSLGVSGSAPTMAVVGTASVVDNATMIYGQNPSFIDIENGDLRVSSCSPVINAGDAVTFPVTINTDIRGNNINRNQLGAIDIGAY